MEGKVRFVDVVYPRGGALSVQVVIFRWRPEGNDFCPCDLWDRVKEGEQGEGGGGRREEGGG
eukprot:761448-Hanusia_phi.AAC.1